MRKSVFVLFVLLASAILAFAEPGTVIRVYSRSFVVRWAVAAPSAGHPRGKHRIEIFVVTPETVFFVNGHRASFADVKNGVHVNVKADSGEEAERVDIAP